MMEAVKIGGRLDLVECLIAAGARLDVQVRLDRSPFEDSTRTTEHIAYRNPASPAIVLEEHPSLRTNHACSTATLHTRSSRLMAMGS